MNLDEIYTLDQSYHLDFRTQQLFDGICINFNDKRITLQHIYQTKTKRNNGKRSI